MLLTIDIGNTNISFGVFREDRLIKRFNIPTKGYNSSLLPVIARRLPKAADEAIPAVICSVVPNLTKTIETDLKSLLRKKPYIIGNDIVVPIKNLYRYPNQVGQDRLVNAYAGVALYGAPLVVVDFGTAITFDVLSRKKEYLGGMILPGLQVSLDALSQRTALLPKIKLGRPQEFIARDTKNSMLSGIIYGFAALSDNLAVKIRAVIGKGALIIGTGGNIDLMAKYCKNFDRIDKDLTLKGLNLLYACHCEEAERSEADEAISGDCFARQWETRARSQ